MNFTGKKSVLGVLMTAGLMLATLVSPMLCRASVVISGTRVIYPAAESEVTIKLSNEGASPALTQVWVDNGDAKASPTSAAVPFIVTPPLSRIDPHKAQTLRILYTGESLPQDKESVFWLDVLEIPPKATGADADANMLQLAFRSRIKLFFRPGKLQGSVTEAPGQLAWHESSEGGKPAVSVTNPSAYYVTVASFDLVDNAGLVLAKSVDTDMVAPGQSKVFPLSAEVKRTGIKVRFNTINDYGGEDRHEAVVQ
ncbi:fimbria/pilus periplasmic chaperone [Rhodanobacter sp. MP7CTX1]|uniref:fimbria/pilus periplasmic chaperone n=1 Tax=Rhodanobacter sp. MP7CTX1 TaxID=2723084 RepID=UPI0016206E60|nr:fimbria/pilus periplasmic chaperone [Rhodanobacter sp. MP7CTX1]MBB6188683.1 fimbrial chaperone protein/chaperone protein EcpD [Rhodanobacter sp. MP7CTX1]